MNYSFKDFDFRDLHLYRDLPERLAIGVSGGRSSAYQMAHIVAAHEGKIPPGWVFNFENTGLELPETLEFVDKLDRCFGLDLRWLEYDPAAPGRYREVCYLTASREGEPMEALLSEIIPKRRDGTAGVRPLPNPAQRVCTAQLKVKTMHRYLRRSLGWPMQYWAAVGYRADEKARYEKKVALDAKRGFSEGGKGCFPMYRAGVVEDRVLSFWRTAPFDLELDGDFGNCDLCFMASTWKIKQRMIHMALAEQVRLRPGAIPPVRVMRWIMWEERESDRPGPFRKNRPTVRQLWEQVCEGNYESAVPEGKNDVCRSCTD